MNEKFKSMTSAVFKILPHFYFTFAYNALNMKLSKTSSVDFCVTHWTVTH